MAQDLPERSEHEEKRHQWKLRTVAAIHDGQGELPRDQDDVHHLLQGAEDQTQEMSVQ